MLPEIKSAMVSNYSKVFLSKKQYLIDDKTNFKSEIPKIISIINNRLNINHDWSSVRGASSLTNNQLIKIQQIVSNETQSELVAIFSPYIEPHLKSIFGNRLEYNIRVSAQIKGSWTIKEIEKKRQGFFIGNIFHEHEKKNNILFPTRAHQDLDNNGNRCSHTLIFYFQLTKFVENSSVLEFGEFEEKVGILPFSSELGYPNEILHSMQKEINWIKPDLTPGNILLMTALTPHRSTQISEIPRIALNVKIQPTNLDYINLIYGKPLDNLKKMKSLDYKLNFIIELLTQLSGENRLALFELAVAHLLSGNREKAKQILRELCLFNIEEEILEKWLLASISRKLIFSINSKDLKKLSNPLEDIVKYSCGHNILSTLN